MRKEVLLVVGIIMAFSVNVNAQDSSSISKVDSNVTEKWLENSELLEMEEDDALFDGLEEWGKTLAELEKKTAERYKKTAALKEFIEKWKKILAWM